MGRSLEDSVSTGSNVRKMGAGELVARNRLLRVAWAWSSVKRIAFSLHLGLSTSVRDLIVCSSRSIAPVLDFSCFRH